MAYKFAKRAMRRAGVGASLADDGKTLDLLAIGAFVHKELALAMALVHRARPLKDPAHAKIIELHSAVVTFLNLQCDGGLAKSVGGWSVELARTPVGTRNPAAGPVPRPAPRSRARWMNGARRR